MGSLTIEIPLKINRSFRVEDKKIAEKLLRDLEEINKKQSAFDDVLGIWAKLLTIQIAPARYAFNKSGCDSIIGKYSLTSRRL